jgi:hypothetical protein
MRSVIKTVFVVGAVCSLMACGPSKPMATHYTSGNCPGPSVSTLHFFAEPTARMFPQAIRLEECPNGKYYMQMGDRPWTEITKKNADNAASALKGAGRRVVRVVDSQ